jgi:hypothetical protein
MLPVMPLRGLRADIEAMHQLVRAIDSVDAVELASRPALLCLCTAQARDLMASAANHWDSIMVLSPRLRDTFAKGDARVADQHAIEEATR